jgi:transketolase
VDREKYAKASGLKQGAYVLADCEGIPAVILIGTGSEVSLCLGAYEALKGEGIKARVVSMPSWELFEEQDEGYRESVLPSAVTARLAVEQGAKHGWDRYVGPKGEIIGMHTFGASAPLSALQKKFGFTPEAVLDTARKLARGGK